MVSKKKLEKNRWTSEGNDRKNVQNHKRIINTVYQNLPEKIPENFNANVPEHIFQKLTILSAIWELSK